MVCLEDMEEDMEGDMEEDMEGDMEEDMEGDMEEDMEEDMADMVDTEVTVMIHIIIGLDITMVSIHQVMVITRMIGQAFMAVIDQDTEDHHLEVIDHTVDTTDLVTVDPAMAVMVDMEAMGDTVDMGDMADTGATVTKVTTMTTMMIMTTIVDMEGALEDPHRLLQSQLHYRKKNNKKNK